MAQDLAHMRQLHVTEIEQEEEYCLEAMLHWHDPVKRVRSIPTVAATRTRW